MSSENNSYNGGLYPSLSQEGPLQHMQREPTPPPPFDGEPAPLPEPRIFRQHSFVSERHDIEKAADEHCGSPANHERGTFRSRVVSLSKVVAFFTFGFFIGTAISEYRHLPAKTEEPPKPVRDPDTVDLSKWFPGRKSSS
jgi:hypothetical protein